MYSPNHFQVISLHHTGRCNFGIMENKYTMMRILLNYRLSDGLYEAELVS